MYTVIALLAAWLARLDVEVYRITGDSFFAAFPWTVSEAHEALFELFTDGLSVQEAAAEVLP